MNRHRIRALSILAAIAIVFGTFQAPSQARTTMASAGRAVAAADYGCFVLSYSTMTNVCSSAKRLETSLPVDASGTYTVKVNAQGPLPSGTVGCEAIGVNESVTLFWASGVRWLSISSAPQNLYMTTTVPSGGSLFVYCDVNPNGRVSTISW